MFINIKMLFYLFELHVVVLANHFIQADVTFTFNSI